MTDEQGRVFGKISIIDIFAVLAVILIAVSVYMRVWSNGKQTLPVTYSDSYEYTVVAEDVSQYTAKALEKSVGQDFFSYSGKKIGVIEKIELVTPSLTPIEQKNGDVITVQHPEKSDVRMVISCEGTKAHAGIMAEGNYIISNGARLEFETKYTFASGRISNVHRVK